MIAPGEDAPYSLEWRPAAKRDLRKLPRDAQTRIKPKVQALRIDPRPNGCEKMSGEDDAWRVRVGNYRVVYEVDDKAEVVTIAAIGHRREVYR